MTDDIPQEELLKEIAQVIKYFETSDNLAPIKFRDGWDTLVESQTAEQRDLLQELARFSDLWRYLHERNKKLGRDIVDAIAQVHRLPVLQRVTELRTINQKLLERIGDADQNAQVRQ